MSELRRHDVETNSEAGPQFNAHRDLPRRLEPAIGGLVGYQAALHGPPGIDSPGNALHAAFEDVSGYRVEEQLGRIANPYILQMVFAQIDGDPGSVGVDEGQGRTLSSTG